MALYKRADELGRSDDPAFDAEHSPSGTVPHSGIYRCRGCGREIASNAGTPFPPQNNHQHRPAQGSVRWRMAAYSQGDEK